VLDVGEQARLAASAIAEKQHVASGVERAADAPSRLCAIDETLLVGTRREKGAECQHRSLQTSS
jgi:hypothetical protein